MKRIKIEIIREQLFALGITALSVGIIPQAVMNMFYPEYGFFTSISASATTGIAVGMVLPFALGILALFMFTYKGYETIDNIISSMIGVCFTLVAAQPCYSPWVEGHGKVGVFGLSPQNSNTVHCLAAVVGFILMGGWVALLFTKSTRSQKTSNKKIRNIIYFFTGILCVLGAGVVMLLGLDIDKPSSPLVWWAEEAVLTAYGIAVLVKSKFWRSPGKPSEK